MTRLRDHERAAGAHDALRLAEDHLDSARVALAGDLTRPRRGLDVVQSHDSPFDLRDRLLRDDEDVSVLELRALGDEARQVVSFAQLGEPLDGRDREGGHRPTISETGVAAVAAIEVDDHGRHALERAGARERARVQGATRDERRRELERERLRGLVVTADERVALGLPGCQRRRCERVQPGHDGGAQHLLDPLGQRQRLIAGQGDAAS